MKRALGLVIVGGMLAAAPAALAQAAWEQVTVNSVGDRFMVDENSIRSNGNSVWYWEYRDFRQPNNAFVEEDIQEPVYGVMLYRSTDCASGAVRMRQLIVHGRDRKEIGRFNYGESGNLSQPLPGSSAASVVRYVCDRRPAQQTSPDSSAQPSPRQN